MSTENAARRTKIVCTIGPATASYETLEALTLAGMNVVRLNMSHADHPSAQRIIGWVRTLNRKVCPESRSAGIYAKGPVPLQQPESRAIAGAALWFGISRGTARMDLRWSGRPAWSAMYCAFRREIGSHKPV